MERIQRIYASNGQAVGFYLKIGVHWVKVVNYGRIDWQLCDTFQQTSQLATRFNSEEHAGFYKRVFEGRWKAPKFEIVEVIERDTRFDEKPIAFKIVEDDSLVIPRIGAEVTLPAMPDWFTKG